jgi:hypothetical protein
MRITKKEDGTRFGGTVYDVNAENVRAKYFQRSRKFKCFFILES